MSKFFIRVFLLYKLQRKPYYIELAIPGTRQPSNGRRASPRQAVIKWSNFMDSDTGIKSGNCFTIIITCCHLLPTFLFPFFPLHMYTCSDSRVFLATIVAKTRPCSRPLIHPFLSLLCSFLSTLNKSIKKDFWKKACFQVSLLFAPATF